MQLLILILNSERRKRLVIMTSLLSPSHACISVILSIIILKNDFVRTKNYTCQTNTPNTVYNGLLFPIGRNDLHRSACLSPSPYISIHVGLSPTFIERFSWSFDQMFSSDRQCMKSISQPFWLMAKVTFDYQVFECAVHVRFISSLKDFHETWLRCLAHWDRS